MDKRLHTATVTQRPFKTVVDRPANDQPELSAPERNMFRVERPDPAPSGPSPSLPGRIDARFRPPELAPDAAAARCPVAGAARPGHAPEGHPLLPAAKIGVLLVNLGTPDAPTAGSVRRYLAEFLSDRRIVNYPRLFWLPLLHGVILNVRPAKTARAYEAVWRKDSDESPLRYYTRETAADLGAQLMQPCPAAPSDADDASPFMVDWAMRYGAPSIADRIAGMKAAGCTRLLVIPLYPQYSSTTTASVHDAVFQALRELKWHPALRLAPAFHDEPTYIAALAARARETMAGLDWTPERVLLSFHGLPERLLSEGDPYYCHCAKTSRLLREEMGWTEEFAPLTFQSKFGPEKWLGPATDDVIEDLAGKGVKRLAVMTPGFVSDCLETLEEIGIEAAEDFRAKGGEEFAAIPCLNDSTEMTELLAEITRRETSGWDAPRA